MPISKRRRLLLLIQQQSGMPAFYSNPVLKIAIDDPSLSGEDPVEQLDDLGEENASDRQKDAITALCEALSQSFGTLTISMDSPSALSALAGFELEIVPIPRPTPVPSDGAWDECDEPCQEVLTELGDLAVFNE